MTKIALFFLLAIYVHSSVSDGTTSRPGLMGGWYEQQVHNKNVQEVSHFAAGNISDTSDSFLHKKMIHVHEAATQVVSGTKYRIVFDLASTVCRKDENPGVDRNQCDLHKDMPIERCTAVIWERVWLNERQLIEFSCSHLMSFQDYFSEENQKKENEFHGEQNTRINSV